MLSLILALATGAPALPLEAEAELAWDAPPDCPTAAQVRGAVEQLAGRWPRSSEFEARGHLTGSGERWELKLWTRVEAHVHEQRLEARTCEGLADAAALIIAVSLDPIASAAAVELADAPPSLLPIAVEPTRETQPAQPPPTPPAPVEAVEQAGVRFLVGAGGGVGAGFSPGLSGGPHLSLGVVGEHARFVLEGRYWAPTTAELDSGTGARLQAGFVAALGCWGSGHPELEALVCGGVESGALRARGRQVVGERTQHFPRLAGVARMGLAWHVRPNISLVAGLDVAISALDAIVVVGVVDTNSAETVYRTPPVGARGVVGVEFSIPIRKR